MKKTLKTKAIRYVKDRIGIHEAALTRLWADLNVLQNEPPTIPQWLGMVGSAWSSDGEPDWEGEFEAPDVREAVYMTMLAFCKKAGRVYPGYKSSGRTYDHFDLQGTIYLSMKLPGGTTVPVDRATLDKFKKEFNNRAPLPKPRPRPEPTGLT